MQNTLLDIEEELSQHVIGDSSLSFKKFIEYIKYRMQTEQTVRTKFYRFVLKKFKQHPELSETVPLEETEKYSELFELIYASLLPFMSDENSNFWGLSMPMLPKVFYGTDRLYELLRDKNTGKAKLSAITGRRSGQTQN